jgi:hypothetical protein
MGCGGTKLKQEQEENKKPVNEMIMHTIPTEPIDEEVLTQKFNKENEHQEYKREKGMPGKIKIAQKTNDNLVEILYYGILEDDNHFKDCLIQSADEFKWKLRDNIARHIHEISFKVPKMKPKVKVYPNIKDELLVLRNHIDFDKYCLIAIKDYYIKKIKLKNEKYVVYTTDDIVASNEYCAALINKSDISPSMWEFASENIEEPSYNQKDDN